ncbi:MAG: translocation/assembly module TamB domain-containing protein, partial [Flavobacteriales bacterium]|nr:translocation/assembly module TamB domain-containing protein [Flavobacteriales bacterium]
MKNSKVQSYITSQVVNYLESKLKTKISIESVDFEFIKTFVFNGIYIEDQQNDTLLYIKTFKFDVDHYNLTNNHFELSKLEFSDGFANVNKVNPSDSVYNFQFILDAFQSDETSGKTVYKINCDKIVLDRFRARYKTDSTLDTTLFNPKDMLLSDLSLKIVNALISPDLISCKLKFLQFRDKCGFEIQDLFGYFSLDSTNLSFTEFEINSNHSEIDGSFNMFKNSGSFRDARYEIAIDPTTNIDYNDLGFFRKEFQNIPYSIDLSGEFAGDLKKLDILKLVLDFGNSSHIFASGILENLDKPNKIAYDIDIQNTVTNYEDISQLPIPFLKDTFIRLPGYFTELKAVQFNANAEGTANDISTEMDLYSAIGNISGDFNTHKVDSIREFSGGLAFTQVKIPDQLTSNFPISGIFASFDFIGETVQDNISIQSTGFLNQALVNKRKLKSVITTFALNKERIEFLIEDSVNHENFTLSGILDLKDQLSLKGTLATTDFDLSQVGVVKQGHQYMLSTQTQFDIKDLKNYMAESNINSSYLKLSDGDSTLESNEISIVSVQSKTEKYIDLQSDLLNLKIDGKFLPENLGRTIEYLKYRALPEYSDTISHENCDQDFAFDLETRKLGDILNFFNLGVQISEPILAKGKISEHCNNVELVSNIPNLTLGEEKFDDIDLQLSIKDSSHFEIKVGDFHISDSVSIRDVFLGLVKIPNKVEYKFSWDNHTIPYTAGLISGDINILADRVRNQFQPSKFTVSDTVWHILANNQIEYFRDTIIVNSLVARHKSQIIGFDGIITSNPNDKLDVVLENFELENLNPFLSEFGLSLSGILDGNLRLFQPTKNIVIDSDVDIEKLAVNEYDIGKGSILTNWSTANSNLTIDANFLGSHQNSIDLKGSYQPQKDNIDVALKLNRFELATVEDFLTGVLSHLKGKLTGDLKVEGSIKSPQIDGKLAFSETEFVVDYLNTKYKLGRDEIVIKDGNAYLKDLKLIDAYGAVANLNGSFTQKKFQSFMYDFTLTNKDAFQYLNTNDYINPSYNGQAFLKNTKVNLKGSNKGISIDVKAKTAKNTQFNIPLSNPEEVTESGFITFVSPKDEKSENAEYQQKIQNI